MIRVSSMHGRDEIACSEGYYNLKEINYLERLCSMESVYCTYLIIAFLMSVL
jgi:hypothetical protein